MIDRSQFAHAVIVHGCHYQFLKAEKISETDQSRLLFWCKKGTGVVQVNGETVELNSNDFILLPWGKSITYIANRKDHKYDKFVF